jgi:hypothetical protein
MYLNKFLLICLWALSGMLPVTAYSVRSEETPLHSSEQREYGARNCYLPCFANNIMAIVECYDTLFRTPCSKTFCVINNLYYVTCSTTKCPNCPKGQGFCGAAYSTLGNDFSRYTYQRIYNCTNWNGPFKRYPLGACNFGDARGQVYTGTRAYWTPCESPGCTGVLNSEGWDQTFTRIRCKNNATSESCP